MGVLERDCQGNYIRVDRNRTAKQPESIGVELQKRLDQRQSHSGISFILYDIL